MMKPLISTSLVAVVVLAGCVSSPTENGSAPAASTPGATSTTVPTTAPSSPTAPTSPAVPTSPVSPTSPVTTPAQSVDWRAGIPSEPAAAAAWEALMAPDGEYAAAAAYQAVLARHGDSVEPYASILKAEQRHIEALKRQLTRLGVTVPADPWAGKVPAPDDLKQAAEAWADGEVANVALYDRLAAQAGADAQLTRVFGNLRRASAEQHLPRFREAAANGGTL